MKARDVRVVLRIVIWVAIAGGFLVGLNGGASTTGPAISYVGTLVAAVLMFCLDRDKDESDSA